MMKPIVLSLTSMAIVLLATGCSGLAKVDVSRVLTSGRDGWQHPERVIESLHLQHGDHVAEIGAGDGYWLRWLSDAVGKDGHVYAVEVHAELVAGLQAYVEKEQLQNVEVIFGDFDDPKLPDGAVDVALTVLTYHHIEERVDYFTRLQKKLRAGGRVAHLDDRPDAEPPISWFQSDGHWTEPGAIVEEMSSAGYVRHSAFDFLQAQSFQVFVPTGSATSATDSDLEDRTTEVARGF